MKRLISWLLALTMIMSLPLSAMAADPNVDLDGEYDEEVDFGELVEPEVGSKENPFVPEWVWNEEQTEATATTCEIKAGATGYITITFGGLELFVNGVSYGTTTGNRWMPQILEIKNDTDAAATYELKLVVPVGTMDNPATLVLGENVATVAKGAQGYFYTYTAEKDGILVLEFDSNTTGWTYTVNNLTTYAYGDIQRSDSDPVVNPAEIEVAANDELQIIVNTYDAASPWEAPAGTVTVNASYKPEGPIVDENLEFYNVGLSLKSGIIAQYIIKNPITTYGYESAKIVVEKAGETVDVTEYTVSGNYIVFEVGFTAKMMTEKATITIYAEKDGVTYVGESLVDWTIKQKAIEMLDNYYPSYVVGGTDTKTLTCNLVANMLAYGAAAQNHFEYNTDDLAIDGLKDEYLALIITETPELTAITYPANPSNAVFNRKNTALSLGANIQLQMIYALPSGVDLADYRAVIVNKDRGTTYDDIPGSEFTVQGSYVVVVFDDMTAQQLRETLQITIYQGDTAVSGTFELSIENVAAGMLSKYPELIPAMMNYSDCAKARFSS